MCISEISTRDLGQKKLSFLLSYAITYYSSHRIFFSSNFHYTHKKSLYTECAEMRRRGEGEHWKEAISAIIPITICDVVKKVFNAHFSFPPNFNFKEESNVDTQKSRLACREKWEIINSPFVKFSSVCSAALTACNSDSLRITVAQSFSNHAAAAAFAFFIVSILNGIIIVRRFCLPEMGQNYIQKWKNRSTSLYLREKFCVRKTLRGNLIVNRALTLTDCVVLRVTHFRDGEQHNLACKRAS